MTRPVCAGQRGYSLVELLVASALGMLVVLAAGSAFVVAKTMYTLQAEQARVQEAGRFALAHIARIVRQSAYREAGAAPDDDGTAFIAGLDSHTLKDSDSALEAALPVARNPSDILALYFSGPAQAGAINCAGMQASGDALDARGASIFYVAPDAGGEPELRCKYHGAHGWNSDALVRGVDSFQVLYGLDLDQPPDGVPNRFVSAREIDALDAAQLSPGADEAERNRLTRWKRVVAVRIALLLRGSQNVMLVDPGVRYDLFGARYADAAGQGDGGSSVAPGDWPASLRRRYRQSFSTTISLRNR